MVNFMEKTKNNGTTKIGIDVPGPKTTCEDRKCPFHGETKVRGRVFLGIVNELTFQKNALVEWERRMYIPKYERYEKRRTKVWAHSPLCLGIAIGDKVKIAETRKLSKTKNFVVIQKME